jgi:hypothetical protein
MVYVPIRSKTGDSLPRRLITREHLCLTCGTVRKAPAAPSPNAPPPPTCCGVPMRMIGYEQAVACTRIAKRDRVTWILAGGRVERRGGRRQWKAVW